MVTISKNKWLKFKLILTTRWPIFRDTFINIYKNEVWIKCIIYLNKEKKLLSMIVDLNYIALDLILIRDLSGILELGKSIS